jgi:density-regulated protein DRP1
MSDVEGDAPPEAVVVVVPYCGMCGCPFEYCEYGPHPSKCAAWLQKEHPAEHQRLYGGDGSKDAQLAESLEALKTPSQAEAGSGPAPADPAPAEGPAGDAAAAGPSSPDQPQEPAKKKKEKKEKESVLTVELVSRNKRKSITMVSGLDSFNIDLKEASKLFGKKFACGASVVKGDPGLPDKIDIQVIFLFLFFFFFLLEKEY